MEDRDILKIVQGIDGWVMQYELQILIKYASKINNGIILDIGTAMGRSSVTLALASPTSTIHTIDDYNNWYTREERTESLMEFQMRHNKLIVSGLEDFDRINKTDLTKRINFIIDDSRKYVWNNGEIDLLFIDGGHSYDTVKSDYERFSPFVKKGGVIICHDYNMPEPEWQVKKYLDELGIPVISDGQMGIIEL